MMIINSRPIRIRSLIGYNFLTMHATCISNILVITKPLLYHLHAFTSSIQSMSMALATTRLHLHIIIIAYNYSDCMHDKNLCSSKKALHL